MGVPQNEYNDSKYLQVLNRIEIEQVVILHSLELIYEIVSK